MIYFDQTNTGRSRHRSGLMRVSERLREELGADATSVDWRDWNRQVAAEDWFLTTELFSESERPGFTTFVGARLCRSAAVFHDAIPLKLPHVTWPQSVARHPAYMKLLANFDRVWAVSAESKRDLEGFWQWQGLAHIPPVEILPLGADSDGQPREDRRRGPAAEVPQLLCLGIVEPRKNQGFLVDVCEQLWDEGLKFELHLVGRVNPHFGRPIVARANGVVRRRRGSMFVHGAVTDSTLSRLYASARVTVFPTIAEGCGLPLIESLWRGVPCVCSDLPALRENAGQGGCIAVPPGDFAAWTDALRRVITDDLLVARLHDEAATRPLPTWGQAAMAVRRALQ